MKLARLRASTISLLLAVLSGAVASAQIVVNGDFAPSSSSSTVTCCVGGPNSGTINWTGGQYGYGPSGIASWTFSPLTNGWTNVGIQQNGSAFGFSADPLGNGQTAFLQSSDYDGGSGGTISQSVDLGLAGTYTVSFYLEQRYFGGPNPVSVSIGDSAFDAVAPSYDAGWVLYSGTFYGSGSELLLFSVGDIGTDQTSGLADVSITPGASTPAGSSLLTLPEDGASLLYLLMAGVACFGSIFFGSRCRLLSLASA